MPSHKLSKSVFLEKTPTTVQKIATSHTDVTEILYNYGNVHNHGQTRRSLTDVPSHTFPRPSQSQYTLYNHCTTSVCLSYISAKVRMSVCSQKCHIFMI